MAVPAPGDSILGPLRVRDFRLLFAGLIVSQAFMPLQFVTQIFWVQQNVSPDYRIVLVGLIGTMRGAGQLGFGLYGGALADRFDRRRLLLITQCLALLITSGVATVLFLGDASAPWLTAFFALSFISAGVFAVNGPTRQAMTAEILGTDLVARGVAFNSAGMQVALPVSLFASGFLIDALGFAGTYALSAAGHAAELAMLLLLRYRGRPRPREGSAGVVRAGMRDILDGYRYARTHAAVWWVIVLMVAMVGLGFPAVANLGPTWVTTVVGVPVKYFGLVAITWALGSFLMSATLARISPASDSGSLVIAGALAFSISFALFSAGHVWPFAVVGNLGLGAGLSLAQISASSFLLRTVPNEVRGRVMSLLMLNMGIAQVITFPLALIAQIVTLEVLFPVLAAACFVLVVTMALRRPAHDAVPTATSEGRLSEPRYGPR